MLKSSVCPLVLVLEWFTLCKKRDSKPGLPGLPSGLIRNSKVFRSRPLDDLWIFNFQRNPSRKLPIKVLKSLSFFLRSSTFRIEWMTVE
jgi:hypothetical protein